MFTSDKVKIYLASGWFDKNDNGPQWRQMNEVYKALVHMEEQGKIEFFSPYYDGIILDKDDPNVKKKMGTVWWLDIEMVKKCDVILVCTQDHDVGTIFEAGYASAIGKIILCYNSNKKLGLNVMLAEKARGFLKNEGDITSAIHKLSQTAREEWKDYTFNEFKGQPV